jgi:hypothetical protein
MPNLAWVCILIIGSAGVIHALTAGDIGKALFFLCGMAVGTVLVRPI